MSQYKSMLVFTDEVSYQSAMAKARDKVNIFNNALGVASNHIAVVDTKKFAEGFTAYFKKEFYKKHKNKIQLDISVDKLLGLLDVNLSPLHDLETKFNSNESEIKWEGNKAIPYVDRKLYERWSRSAEENEKVKAGRKFISAIEELQKYSKCYPLDIARGTSGLITFNLREKKYMVNLN